MVTPRITFGKWLRPSTQGHSKKALGGEEDGIETVLGEGLTNGRERSRQRPRQAQDRVAQRCQRLWGAAGAHSAGVLAQAHVPAPVQLVLNRPMPAQPNARAQATAAPPGRPARG